MALSDEQNAMLRLLAQGEQGYADIAALLGLSEAEVRAKVVGALAQLQAEGSPVPDVPPPLPGGARPAAEATPPEPEPVEPVAAASDEPAEPVIADSVAPRAAPAPPPASPPPSARPAAGGRTVTLPSGRNAWLLGGAVVAVIVAIVVVIVLASGGGDNSGSTTAAEGKAGSAAASSGRTEARLKAVGGSEASGIASFGRVKNKLALQVEATGLEPTSAGTDSYTIWLAQSPQKMLPLAFPVAVKASGKGAHGIAAQFEVPIEVLAYLANGTFDQIAITRTDDKRLEASVEAARKQKTSPAYTGEAVLRGTITGPIVGLAVREEEAKKKQEGGK